jgi:hypothetical protein
MKLSLGERLKIQRLRTNRIDWHCIASQVGCTEREARDAGEARYSDKHKRMLPKPKKHSKFSEIYGPTMGRLPEHGARVHVPVAQILDRDRRAELDHQTFGGPKPGYSALDRKHTGAKP